VRRKRAVRESLKNRGYVVVSLEMCMSVRKCFSMTQLEEGPYEEDGHMSDSITGRRIRRVLPERVKS
jgi:hypothetical protein